MTLKQFCKTLQDIADKLAKQVKNEINDFNNIVFGNTLDETKLALERAKDYHYKEIMNALNEILKQVKIVVFHQDKIEWLSDETNFTANDLKRFSYVKRQVYVFSNPEETHPFSRSEENLARPFEDKKERRKTVSEVSIGSLEAWEKYLDQKDSSENQLTDMEDAKKMVPKRTLSNARARKKFVSSTMIGFLEDDASSHNLVSTYENASLNEETKDISECEPKMYDNQKEVFSNGRGVLKENNRRRTNLYSIYENVSLNDINEDDGFPDNVSEVETELASNNFIVENDANERLVQCIENLANNNFKDFSGAGSSNNERLLRHSSIVEEDNIINHIMDTFSTPNDNVPFEKNRITNNDTNAPVDLIVSEICKVQRDTNNYCDLVDKTNNSITKEEDILNQILKNFSDDDVKTATVSSHEKEDKPTDRNKPKVVDIIYKKQPN